MTCATCNGPLPSTPRVWLRGVQSEYCSAKCRRKRQRRVASALLKERYAELILKGATSQRALYGRVSVKRRDEVLAELGVQP